MATKPSKVVHCDYLKRATIKPCVHKLSESKLKLSSSTADKEDLWNYTKLTNNLQYRSTQNVMPLNLKRRQKSHDCAMTPRKE